jgi:hypothetical protein
MRVEDVTHQISKHPCQLVQGKHHGHFQGGKTLIVRMEQNNHTNCAIRYCKEQIARTDNDKGSQRLASGRLSKRFIVGSRRDRDLFVCFFFVYAHLSRLEHCYCLVHCAFSRAVLDS